MTSINFNASATTALRTLQQTNSALETSQNRVSTGLKIGEAKDNAAYWSISTTLKSDNKAMSTVKDALGLGAATVDVAYQGLNAAKDVLDEIKSKLTAASQDGVDRTKIQSEIVELQKQLVSIATSSTFSGENWLSTTSTTPKSMATVVASFTRSDTNSVTLGTIDIALTDMALVNAAGDGILGKASKPAVAAKAAVAAQPANPGSPAVVDDPATPGDETAAAVPATAATPAQAAVAAQAAVVGSGILGIDITVAGVDIQSLIATVSSATDKVITAASTLGAVSKRIELQQTFVANLMDTIDEGVSGLIDADLSEESTRLQALQTKQQLGIQALSIANTSTQNILSLFRS